MDTSDVVQSALDFFLQQTVDPFELVGLAGLGQVAYSTMKLARLLLETSNMHGPEQVFDMGAEIGCGKFGTVFKANHRQTLKAV